MWAILALGLLAIVLIIAAIAGASYNFTSTPKSPKSPPEFGSIYKEFQETATQHDFTFTPPDNQQYYVELIGYGNGSVYGPELIQPGDTVEFNLNSPANSAQSAVKVAGKWNLVTDGTDITDTTPARGYILIK